MRSTGRRMSWRGLASGLLLLALTGLFPDVSKADMAPIFGPTKYTRGTGAPQTFTDTFVNCETAAQYELVVVNGNPDGSGRISSAAVYLNGTQVVGPKDFNENVAQLIRPVTVAGSNTMQTTIASAPGSFLTVSIRCVRGCLSVQITGPSSGSSLSLATTNVGGTVSSSADEVGIVVNGIPALVEGGQFQAPNVALVIGTNSLTVTATNACLNQATAAEQVTVTALNAPPVTVTAVPTGGLAPLAVTFRAMVSAANPITQYQWDFNGDGIIDSSGPTLSQASNTYGQSGLYVATVKVTDSVGNQYTGQTPVQVLSGAALTTLIQRRWSSLVAALSSQDIGTAVRLFQSGVAERFQGAFTSLRSQLPQIAASLGNISLVSASGGLAEFVIVRAQQGNNYVYFVSFMQDSNGLWKIVGM
jgi:hypothetical protein